MYLKVVRAVEIFSLDAVAGTYGPVLAVDGSAAKVEFETKGNVLEAELVGKLSWRGVLSTDDLVETPTEGGLTGGGGC